MSITCQEQLTFILFIQNKMKLQGPLLSNYEDDNSRALNQEQGPVTLDRSHAHKVEPGARHIHTHIAPIL